MKTKNKIVKTKQAAWLFIAMLMGFTFTNKGVAQVKIAGAGVPTTVTAGTALELEATDRGLLLPRMITTERDLLTPVNGMMIYNTTGNCVNYYENSVWVDPCAPGIPGNATCATATISVTSCTAAELSSGINGGSLGNKYNNGSGGTYSVVEIGGQCWMQENIDVDPAGAPTWVNNSDEGWYGYYNNTYQAVGEGTLLQWSAAMNNTTAERAQGVCPTGWHVPSDCEWMYLENSLGMTTAEQQATGFRGTEGQDLSTLVPGGTNSSGFTALLAGSRNTLGTFSTRGAYGYWWSSSETGATPAHYRILFSSQAGVQRFSINKAGGFSVRCLKD